MKREKDIVYISGPITGTEDWRERFNAAEKYLKWMGYLVFNPATISEFFIRESKDQFEYEDFMDIDLILVEKCTKLYMLKGWQNSKGASREYEKALECGKEIMYEDE